MNRERISLILAVPALLASTCALPGVQEQFTTRTPVAMTSKPLSKERKAHNGFIEGCTELCLWATNCIDATCSLERNECQRRCIFALHEPRD